MPRVFCPDEALEALLTLYLNTTGTFHIDLFKANVTPDADSAGANFTRADYTIASGTIRQVLTFPNPVTLDTAHIAQMLSGDVTFPLPSSGSQNIYGWIVTDPNDDMFLVKRFDAPVTVTTSVGISTFAVSVRAKDILG